MILHLTIGKGKYNGGIFESWGNGPGLFTAGYNEGENFLIGLSQTEKCCHCFLWDGFYPRLN